MTNQNEQVIQEVSGRLKKIIDHLKFSQVEFAESLGYGPGYINHMVNGLKPLSGGFIYDFCRVFGNTYNIDWLMTGKGEMAIENQPATAAEPPTVYRRSGSIEERILELERRADRTEKILDAILQYRESR